MPNYLSILEKYWGYNSFRGIQEDIITSIGKGKDTLGLMPTGGGKSITFQVPALAKEGICIVITPLIALMKDQVQNLRNKGIKATAVYSGMSRQEILITFDNCIFGDYKFLYLSPERLDTDMFKEKVKRMPVNLIAVDESHCISQWGYNFRPAYLKIAEIRELLPDVPILALTATATPKVVIDIQKKLDFKKKNVFKMSFERNNLAYLVHHTEDKVGVVLNLLKKLNGSAIIYARSRRRTKEYSRLIAYEGITSTYYHAGLNNDIKDQRQEEWRTGKTRVIVATNAFGMGIDKPDVRLVIHVDLPDSIEAYFQEAGRVGRDQKNARAILLYSNSDKAKLQKRIKDNFPPKEYVKKVYEHIQYYYQMALGDGLGCIFDFNLEEFCVKFKHFPVVANSALNLLTQAGYLEYTDEQDNPSRILFKIHREELYRLKEMGPDAENLLQVLLRSYTGLFTDYANISEETLAIRTDLDREKVYKLLTLFARRGIVDYIPRKKTPFIIYTRERINHERVFLPKEVYDDRKEQYIKRVKAIFDYATDNIHCRNRVLLHYFGEDIEDNCGQCDVCINQRQTEISKKDIKNVMNIITTNLGDEEITVKELREQISMPEEKFYKCIRYLIDEEKLIYSLGKIKLPTS